ncbi:hypothetical protein Q361_12314 [Flavobacterium croceum DSM 17960]|uniref:WG repeat protein n=1 Tax=Flavobacterium croceum DSM 17960 TaxID=1121886 RepID=A0A2S4N4W3_9FLAO|nr:hypothetical protein [Flavobacterium croceum]POS00779.1 hypothetical protein Q361_12314 [Flavobacterium croceum DSM 17960]
MKHKIFITFIMMLLSAKLFSQGETELDSKNNEITKEYRNNNYQKANDLLNEIISNSNLTTISNPKFLLNNDQKILLLNNKSKISEKLNDLKTAISSLKQMMEIGSSINDAYGLNFNRIQLAKLYLKDKENELACDQLEIVSNYIYDYDGRYKDEHLKAMKLKDSVCSTYLKNKSITAKKSKNPNYGNQAPAFSLLGGFESDIENLLGKPKGKLLEHRGDKSYDAYIYKTKWGEYRIAYEDGQSFIIWFYPIIKQKFDEKDLFYGGKFNIENDFLKGSVIGNTSKGFVNGQNYFSIDYEYNSSENHSIIFYGKKSGLVTKILIY